MTDAKIRITAENRIGAAVASAERDLNRLARSSERIGRLFNRAFAIGVGFGFTRLLREVAESTEKAGRGGDVFARKLDTVKASFRSLLAVRGGLPEVNQSLDQLTATLQSPAVATAADAFFGSILSGAVKAANGIAQIAGGLRALGTQFGLFEARTQQEKIDRLDTRIGPLRQQEQDLADMARRRNLTEGEQARYRGVRRQLDALAAEQQRVQEAGPTGADAAVNVDPFRRNRGSGLFARSVNPQTQLELQRSFEYLENLQRESEAFDRQMENLEEVNINRITAMRDVFQERFEEMSEFAKQAAGNMQTAFADFLFDPFEDGLDGMLKNFSNVLRRLVAEAAATKIFDPKSKGGLGLGGFLTDLFGFQHGGSFKVGGSGGADSQVVAFRASPGEHVAVTPSGKGGAPTIIQHIGPFYAGSDQELRAAMPEFGRQTVRAAVAAVRDEVRRGRI